MNTTALNVQRQPGPLVEPLGGRVEQYYALDGSGAGERRPGRGHGSIWAEQLSTQCDG